MHLRVCLLLLPLLLLVGCQKAGPYSPNARKAVAENRKKPLAIDLPAEEPVLETVGWMDAGRQPVLAGDLPIEFVHEGTSPEKWAKLGSFWNDGGLPRAVGVIGLPGVGGVAALAGKDAPLEVKVPLGLDDPLAFIPASNPPTRNKWELGRQLFFDPGWLTAKGNQSCASCHQPERGFADDRKSVEGSFNVPTLVNVVYNTHQFWDGRAVYLEEVVARTLADERDPKETRPFDHVWHGVVARLRDSKAYSELFNKTFGTAATQDTVGKALATYLRTLLAGDSVHDRATQVQQKKGARGISAEHYLAVLDEESLKGLGRVTESKEKTATDLARGAGLFFGKASCAACHPASNGTFSDGRFYNIGVESENIDLEKGGRLGRFAHAPYGEKGRHLKGAYKVPTLRSLTRTGPYFHDGSGTDLVEAVRQHVKPSNQAKVFNPYLDPRLAGAGGEPRDFGLTEQDIADVALFLRALNGREVDRAVRDRTK